MKIEELIKKDPTFTEKSFIAKVDNIFVMLYLGIMMDDILRVKHKVSEDIYNKYSKYLEELNSKNERQMYSELNVKSTSIVSISEEIDKYVIEVSLISRYMDYIVDKTTLQYKRGINTNRIEKQNHLVFTKLKNVKSEQAVKVCPGCGSSMDTNSTGKCSYCGSIYNTEDYDWVLTDIK